MHSPSNFMLARMGLAEFGMWATRVEGELVLVVKMSTETLKWIYRGVKVNLLVAHALVDGKLIRVVGLEVFDCQTDPLLPNMPQVELWEVTEFDALLAKGHFRVYFHNEQPFLSVLDATGSLPRDAVNSYLEQRKAITIHSRPGVTPEFQSAQEMYEAGLEKKSKGKTAPVAIQRWPLTLSDFSWNSMAVPNAGSFTPDERDEGGSFENLLVHVLQPNFPGNVILKPKIEDRNKLRELCDVLATDKSAFLFEAKAFSVLGKRLDQSAERKTNTVMKHFGKALGQLQGAVKRLSKGVEIISPDGSRALIKASDFSTIHGIVMVSNSHYDLPWNEIGTYLADAQKPPDLYFHFLDLTELQRTVAFCSSSSNDLNQILVRRGQIVVCSKNALFRSEFIPEPPGTLSLPPADNEASGLLFAWAGEGCADWLRKMFHLVYSQLAKLGFSGRVDFCATAGRVHGLPGLGIGIFVNSTNQATNETWWQDFKHALFASFAQNNLPQPVINSPAIKSVAEICKILPEIVLAVEFQEGHMVAKKGYL